MSRGVGQSRVKMNTHTHTRWYWYEYMNARLKICQPHTHYNDVYYTWLPKYGQKNLVLPSIYTVYGDFWKGLLWYWCLGAIWIFTMTWKKERGLFIYWRRKKIYENDFFYREKVLLCVYLDLFLLVLSIWLWIVNSMDSGWRVGFY